MKDSFVRKKDGKRYAAVCILLAAVLILASCSLIPESLRSGTSRSGEPEQQEILIPVTRGTISADLSFVGNLRYKQSSNLTWKTNGVIEKVYVNVGDAVKKDDILAELDPDYLSSTVLIAEKNVVDGEERLEDVRESETVRMQAYVDLNIKAKALTEAKLAQEALYYPRATRYEMERAWDAFALANLNFNYAKQDYDHLVDSGEGWEGFEEGREVRFGGRTFVIGKDDRSARERKFEDYVSTYDTLVSAYEKYVWTSGMPSATDYAVAEGNVQVAQKEYEKALETYRSYEELPREKDVQAAEISLNNAETIYKQRYIYAPFDGIVTAVSAVEDYYITRGTNAVRMDDMSEIYLPLSISELDLSLVSPGTTVTITVDAVSGKTYKGHILDISDASAASGNTTSFTALVVFDSPDSGLLAGMTAEVSVPAHEKENTLLIPNEAVSYHDGKPTVTVVNGTERHTVAITMGVVSGNITEVISDNLQEGDLLLVSSISADSLRSLGLDPSDYPTSGRQMQPGISIDHSSGLPGQMSDGLPSGNATETVFPGKDESAAVEKSTQTPMPDVGGEDFSENLSEVNKPENIEPGAGRFPGQMSDGQFPDAGSRPQRNRNGIGEDPVDGQRLPEGNGNGHQFQRNMTPQPTITVESTDISGKG